MLSAARRAGLSPIRVSHLHVVAYLAEALSPVWDLGEGRDVLKRSSLPYLPEVQRALDHLIMIGVVQVLTFDVEEDSPTASATCALDSEISGGLLRRLHAFSEERAFEDFLLEICLGFARHDSIEQVFLEDASYSDPTRSVHRLIELSEGSANLSSVVASSFDAAVGARLSAPQRVALYMNLLANRAANE